MDHTDPPLRPTGTPSSTIARRLLFTAAFALALVQGCRLVTGGAHDTGAWTGLVSMLCVMGLTGNAEITARRTASRTPTPRRTAPPTR